MKIAGHTMGTPEYTVTQAIELFHKIGADGVEIVVQDGYRSGIPCDCSEEILSKIKQCAEENSIEITCLTPYNSHFDSVNESLRQNEIDAIRKVINYCDYLGARYIRLYGGNLVSGDTKHLTVRRCNLIRSLRRMGDLAAEKGIVLLVENHFNTMAVSAQDSAKLIQDVDHPAVRILYDQANLTFTENEGYKEAISLQQDYVDYIHVKDLVFKEGKTFVSSEVSHPDESERNVITRIVGQGILEWPAILKMVKEHGYEGWFSLEYERRWHPDDVPDASIGMKKSIEYLQTISS